VLDGDGIKEGPYVHIKSYPVHILRKGGGLTAPRCGANHEPWHEVFPTCQEMDDPFIKPVRSCRFLVSLWKD